MESQQCDTMKILFSLWASVSENPFLDLQLHSQQSRLETRLLTRLLLFRQLVVSGSWWQSSQIESQGLLFHCSSFHTSPMFFFAEVIQCGNSNSDSLGPSLGMCFFNGIVVKVQLTSQKYIPVGIPPSHVSFFCLWLEIIDGCLKWKVKYRSEALFYKPVVFLAAIVESCFDSTEH